MALTEKYEFEELSYGTQGWNGIMQSNFEKIDDHLHTRGQGLCGENVGIYKAVYWKSDGKVWLAQANGSKQPCIGLMIEGGLTGEEKRFQTYGLITNAAWLWSVGVPIYLDPTIPGALTETPSSSNVQIIGYSQSATTIFLTPLYISSFIGVQPYDIPVMYNGRPTNSLVLLRIEMVRAIVFPVSLTLSRLKSLVAATAETIFSLKKNGTEFGTFTFAISGTTATVVSAAGATFAAGDVLTLVAPASADATLADLYGMIVGSR